MRRTSMLLLMAMLGAIIGPADGSDDAEMVDGVFSKAEYEMVASLSPLPERPPADPTNKYADDPKAAQFGQKMFFERGYAGPIITGDDGVNGGLGKAGETGKIACIDCHASAFMTDNRSKPNNASLGADWMTRNAGTIINAMFYQWAENDGIRDTLWADAIIDVEFPLGFNSSRLRLAHVVFDKYRADYEAAFGPMDPALDPASPEAARFPADARPKAKPEDPNGPYEAMTPDDRKHVTRIMVNVGKALHAYQRLIVSRNAPFDKYVAGDRGAISPAAKRGLKLFIGKANCIGCHSGPLFSDQKFHNINLAAEGPHIVPTETGRFNAINDLLGSEFRGDGEYSDDRVAGKAKLAGLTAQESDKGKWRTKGLREIKDTPPYMHTGQFATLTDVIKFYNEGGSKAGAIGTKDELMGPLNLSVSEIADLVAFLETLTGDPIPAALLQDTSKKSP